MFDNLFILVGPFMSAAILFVSLVAITGLFSVGRHFRRMGPRASE